MIPRFNSDEEAEKFFSANENEGQQSDDIGEDSDITLIDLEGETYEVIDSMIFEGKTYIAILPFDEDEQEADDEVAEFTLLEVTDDPDDEDNCTLKTVDDDDLYVRLGDEFLKRLESDLDEE